MTSKYSHQNRFNNISPNDQQTFYKSEEKQKFTVFDTINTNNLSSFYNNNESIFKKRVDKLNIRFYLETDKFLNIKTEMDKTQDNLFLVLFKQVSLYVEEIERLNTKLKEKEEQEKMTKINKDEIIRKESLEKEIHYYKSTMRGLEKKLNEKQIMEERMKKENESFRRQIVFYKDKLRLEPSNRKNNIVNGQSLISSPNRGDKSFRNASRGNTSRFASRKLVTPLDESVCLSSRNGEPDETKAKMIKRISSASCDKIEELAPKRTDNGIVMSAVKKQRKLSTGEMGMKNNKKSPMGLKLNTNKITNKQKFVEKFVTSSKMEKDTSRTVSNFIKTFDNAEVNDNTENYMDLYDHTLADELDYLNEEENNLNLLRNSLMNDIHNETNGMCPSSARLQTDSIILKTKSYITTSSNEKAVNSYAKKNTQRAKGQSTSIIRK